jgi:hypothetical protein
MSEKKKKQEQTASSTGIPVDIVGLDVVKIGIMLGLIKNKELFENNIKTKSLLQMLMGEDTDLPKATCPPGYYKSLSTITEKEKIEYQQNYVHVQSKFFVEFREQVVKIELENINKHVDIKFHNETTENFKTQCLELLDVFIEDLTETPEDENIWKIITIITNSLLGVLSIGEYKKFITSHIHKIHQNLPNYEFKIMTHLSTIDRLLSLFNGVLRKCKDFPHQTTQEIQQRLCNELEIRNFTKNPQLQPFVFNDIVKEVCVPSIMYLPIEWIFQKCMLGPYRNNSIGFLHTTPGQGDFYILTAINPDGGRTWVVDHSLQQFTKNIIIATVEYIVKMFRTLYFECFLTNDIVIKQSLTRTNGRCSTFSAAAKVGSNNKKKKTPIVDSPTKIHLTTNCLQEQVFKMLLRNLEFFSDSHRFRNFLFAVIKQSSPIIPTENDFFNYIKSFYDLRQSTTPIYYDDMKNIFQHHLYDIFDDYNPSLYLILTNFIKKI